MVLERHAKCSRIGMLYEEERILLKAFCKEVNIVENDLMVFSLYRL